MTREEVKNYIGELKMYAKSQGWDEEYQIACDVAMNELEQEPILDKIREQITSNLRGVEIALEVLAGNHPLRQKMEGAKDTLEDCLELIDKAESKDKE